MKNCHSDFQLIGMLIAVPANRENINLTTNLLYYRDECRDSIKGYTLASDSLLLAGREPTVEFDREGSRSLRTIDTRRVESNSVDVYSLIWITLN